MASRIARGILRHAGLLGAAGIAASPLLLAGTWQRSHEELRYVVLTDLFASALREGVAWPRWLPDLYGGYGYPTFCFYQPGFFFVGALFSLLPLPLHRSLALALVALLYAGALGAWHLGAALANRRHAAFAAALFLLTPYLYVDLYVRGDLSEAMALLLGPWSFVALLALERRLARGESPALAMLGLAAAIAALVLAHPVPPLAPLPALAATAAALGWRTAHGRALALAAFALLLRRPRAGGGVDSAGAGGPSHSTR